MVQLAAVLDQVDRQSILLPEFQRGYVWSREQIRGLMRSMYLEYPVGSLLVWETDIRDGRGVGANASAGPKQLLLDGQQRITSLYGVVRGKPPAFYEGEPDHFTGLHFNVDTEVFEFYAPNRMRGDPCWVDITEIFTEGVSNKIRLLNGPEYGELFPTYVERLLRLQNVRNRDFHVEAISGPDKTIDVVVDIFNRVNSGGTKLSKGDLALARICAGWDDARPRMRSMLETWKSRGFDFPLDWLLRGVNAIATGKAPFSALEGVEADTFENSLGSTARHIDHLLSLCAGRLGLDNDRVLLGRYAFPVLVRHLDDVGGRFQSGQDADVALYWLLQAALRGRYAGAAETTLGRDIDTVGKEGLRGLIASLKRSQRGGLRVRSSDFESSGRGSRFFPLLYLLLRARGGRDLLTGGLLSESSEPLVVHELFPRSILNSDGYARAESNSIANYALVLQSTSKRLPKRVPLEYFESCSFAALESQSIPTEKGLWVAARYRQFLANRQRLLSDEANRFFDELLEGAIPWSRPLQRVGLSEEADYSDARQVQISNLIEELENLGYSTPFLDYEISDPETGRELAIAEAYWPKGLQAGIGSPVVLELDPEDSDTERLAELSYEVFTSVDALRNYVTRREELASGQRLDGGGVHVSLELAEEPEQRRVVTGPLSHDEHASHSSAAAHEVPDSSDLRKQVIDVINECMTKLDYNPRYFTTMLSQYGVVDSIRKILNAPNVSDGFVRLWQSGRMDLTVEAIALRPENHAFFTDAERKVALQRLASFGYEMEHD